MNETMSMITSLISGVGFPIVAVIFLWKFITSSQDKTNDAMTALTKATEDNSRLLEKLCDKIDQLGRDGK